MHDLGLQTVVFHEPKVGAPDSEWEDCAGHRAADPRTGRAARLVVVDGATEAYDSVHWVAQLVGSFVSQDGPPALKPNDLDHWFGLMQEQWAESPREFADIYGEHRFKTQGSFATFLGCDVDGLEQAEPHWYGAALGDAVLFQIRAGELVAQLPAIRADMFGNNPDGGIFTQPSARQRMRDSLKFADNQLEVGDVLYLTTDALAHWLLSENCWQDVVGIEHPRAFRLWIAEQRASGMKNDDVTMLRAELTAGDVEVLVLCR